MKFFTEITIENRKAGCKKGAATNSSLPLSCNARAETSSPQALTDKFHTHTQKEKNTFQLDSKCQIILIAFVPVRAIVLGKHGPTPS